MADIQRIGVGNDKYHSVDESVINPVDEVFTFDSTAITFDSTTDTFDEQL